MWLTIASKCCFWIHFLTTTHLILMTFLTGLFSIDWSGGFFLQFPLWIWIELKSVLSSVKLQICSLDRNNNYKSQNTSRIFDTFFQKFQQFLIRFLWTNQLFFIEFFVREKIIQNITFFLGRISMTVKTFEYNIWIEIKLQDFNFNHFWFQ